MQIDFMPAEELWHNKLSKRVWNSTFQLFFKRPFVVCKKQHKYFNWKRENTWVQLVPKKGEWKSCRALYRAVPVFSKTWWTSYKTCQSYSQCQEYPNKLSQSNHVQKQSNFSTRIHPTIEKSKTWFLPKYKWHKCS